MDQKKDNWGLPGWTVSASIGESTYNEGIHNDRHMSDIRPAADNNGGNGIPDPLCIEICRCIMIFGQCLPIDCHTVCDA
jgi:hypothetical protein